jgi:hypothetical protein
MRKRIKFGATILLVTCYLGSPLRAVELYLWNAADIEHAAERIRSESRTRSTRETESGIREDAALQQAYQMLITQANGAMTKGPFSVVDKTSIPPSGDVHDFCTLSPYFWPISFLPGGKPYYFRDGKVNPEAKSAAYDRERYFEFMRTVQTLALAYTFSGEEHYAERAATLLRVWFLDEATSMNPHFKHAQAIPGLMQGCSLGVIRGSELVMILDATRLVAESEHWTEQDEAGLKAWYSRYLDWVEHSDFGKKDGKRKNNHGTWHDVHMTAVALYVGREDLARKIAQAVPELRLERQINAAGEQKYELRRSRSWEYSLYNLRGLYAMADLAERVGVDLWNYQSTDEGVNPLQAATSFLAPYAAGDKEWPHHQLKKSDAWAKELGACVFREAVRRYGAADFGQTLAYLDDLDATHRLRLLHDQAKQQDGERPTLASLATR